MFFVRLDKPDEPRFAPMQKRAGLASFWAKPARQVRRSVLIFVFDVIPPEQQRNAPKPRKAHNGI